MATDLPPDLWVPPVGDTYSPLLTSVGLRGYLVGQGLAAGVPVIDGPDIPSDPGAFLLVTWLPGSGFKMEQALDSPAFQIRTIGPQGNRAAARELAERVDLALVGSAADMSGPWPAPVGGRWVVFMGRTGGRPHLDRTDAAERAHYVCTYFADVEAQ